MHFRWNFLVKKLKLPETVSLFPGLAWCPILYFCFIYLCAWLGIKPPKFLVIIIELKKKLFYCLHCLVWLRLWIWVTEMIKNSHLQVIVSRRMISVFWFVWSGWSSYQILASYWSKTLRLDGAEQKMIFSKFSDLGLIKRPILSVSWLKLILWPKLKFYNLPS